MRNATAALALAAAIALAIPAHAKDCNSFVYVSDQSTTISNDCDDDGLTVTELRKQYGKHFAAISRGGRKYVITEPSVLSRIEEAYRAQVELGSRQAELGSQQAALGAQQASLGAEQARIALSGSGEDQRRLSRRQSELGRQQSELGRRQSELGRQQSEAGREASRTTSAIFDEAIRTGVAKPIR